ncbi:MAG: tripartite tricarboxylate transporter TctB family protein [Albidovulum sp.]|nr:tripartite tricarboxylate transporter TctB family protein [Albidovulum sp.]
MFTVTEIVRRYWLPAVIAAFCAAVFWTANYFERVPPILKRGIQPADFPQLVSCLIIFLSLLLALGKEQPKPKPLSREFLLSLALMVGFVVVATIDLFLALGAFAASLSALWGERRVAALLGVGLALPVGAFLLFDQVFRIRFPRGLLTSIWYG